MKYYISFLLIFIAFQNIQANYAGKQIRNKLSLAAIKLRKLQQRTDEHISETSLIIPPIPSDIPQSKATADPVQYTDPESIPKPEPVSTDKVNATAKPEFKVKKFHTFKQASNGIKFGLFFNFLGRPVVRAVIMRIVITYKTGRLRSLQAQPAGESTPTQCVIKKEYEDKIGQTGTGENIDYDCVAPTSSNAPITNAVIDTSAEMIIGDEKIEVSDVAFSPDSDVSNIAGATKVALIIDNAFAKTNDERKLTITGNATPLDEAKNKLSKNTNLNVQFLDLNSDEMKSVPCTVIDFQDADGTCTLECATDNNPIKFNAANLTLSTVDDEEKNIYLTFNTNQDELIDTNPASHNYFRKSSGGLSGGAIAGIVIACVVVLAAASIAAIMLKKPTPAMDQTTVVDLKTVE